MKTLLNKLRKVAAVVAAEKPELRMFGLVHREGALYDHWDLLMSSDQLEPWSMEALKYIAKLLKKHLTVEELIKVARIVVLPRDHEIITWLLERQAGSPDALIGYPADRFDQALAIWPEVQPQRTRRRAKHAHSG